MGWRGEVASLIPFFLGYHLVPSPHEAFLKGNVLGEERSPFMCGWRQARDTASCVRARAHIRALRRPRPLPSQILTHARAQIRTRDQVPKLINLLDFKQLISAHIKHSDSKQKTNTKLYLLFVTRLLFLKLHLL